MNITADILNRISKTKPPAGNVQSLVDGLNDYGAKFGLDQPHRQAQFLAQIMHESGGLKYNKEIWGPTAAQKKYEGRKDLGNTQKGDGSKYRGYGLIQVTGRSNVTQFYKWCVANSLNPPNFVEKPELIATAPWSAVSAIWYWDTRKLNEYADHGDIENITRKVNGGLNGYDDRLSYYDRSALVLLGYGVNEVAKFQKDNGLKADGLSGPLTRGEMQKDLLALTKKSDQASDTKKAPVVSETKVPVKLGNPEKPWWQSTKIGAVALSGGGITTAISTAGSIPWQHLLILVGSVFAALLGFLIYRHIQDRKEQAAKAEAVKS